MDYIELADIHFVYSLANGNSNAARRLYAERILKGGCQIGEHLLWSIVVCGKLAVLMSGVKLGVHGMYALCNLKRKFSNTSMKIRLLVPVQLRITLVAISPLCSGLSGRSLFFPLSACTDFAAR